MDDGPFPSYDGIIYGFANLPKDHPMLDFLVELQCRGFSKDMDNETEIERRAQLPNEFLIRVMLRYSSFKDEGWPVSKMDPCDYHWHVSEEDRENCPVNKKALD